MPPEHTPPDAAQPDRPFFRVALNLPHAGRVARRINVLLSSEEGADRAALEAALLTVSEIRDLLEPAVELDDNPAPSIAVKIRDQVAMLGRRLVLQIESGKLGHDRLGQCVRNLFECLGLGLEGADISLRAGEDPGSMQRPF
ncbi:MAG TPA: hypothetical protein VGG34_14935 [Opitutaceae bacterium]|jgi:hypothetical protein